MTDFKVVKFLWKFQVSQSIWMKISHDFDDDHDHHQSHIAIVSIFWNVVYIDNSYIKVSYFKVQFQFELENKTEIAFSGQLFSWFYLS